jgi:hypothetical protein
MDNLKEVIVQDFWVQRLEVEKTIKESNYKAKICNLSID